MARMRDSRIIPLDRGIADASSSPVSVGPDSIHDRSIGDILQQTRDLTADQIATVLQYQRDRGMRFGEAAIALGLVSDKDVLFALSQQFHYHYAPDEQRRFSDELVVANRPFSQQAESFRAIRSQLTMRVFGHEGPRPALAIVSPDTGDGKTFFSANLAVALSQLGGRTLLVDADMRGPRQQYLFGIENTAGLSGLLSGRSDAHVIQQVADLPSLYVLPVGTMPPNPLELFERPAFGLLLRELTSKFDYVIVDTPAAVYGADANVIAAKCGAALVVARKNSSHVKALQDLVRMIAEGPAKLAGVIVNEY
ncbi:polysaccharide biosynthesis tyrosine autokinase [Methylibium sp.]|uniref:polysaccharide biosynthesis tyrosine autokinase n=1 Tax=Methylibium sp. TaxID=2067992 RepID=UPI003D119C0B